ncbi:DUF3558 domain-containing protein [Nocardia macrotermitis]|uniref:DUF3558 domain-containing protein n=1 Tax=Nocardia macrotermitis TaxID=2585198 RepID=UPI0018861C7E|nr:DUF3558 domain-containing protein [Nocardia macrotermitis]
MATTLVVAACTADHDGGGAAASSVAAATSNSAIHPPFPTLTAPSLQPPKQQNENRPDVAFDPCTWIDDHTVQKIGYDPSTRKRSIDIHAEYTFLSCEFLTADKAYSIEILSGNRTMDEGRQKFTTDGAQIEDATIEGRAAMIVRTKTPESCDVLLQTKAGYVDFDRIIAGYLIDGPTPERCSGIVDLVRSIVPRIGNY